ncbi:MAG: hypothetical protein LAT82_03175 [Nanoarchaeota archaeon]|nr:hypothetical protein [Nanoarchaeota archaeon]
MLKIHTKDIKPILFRFRVFLLILFVTLFSIILGGIFIGIIPFIGIFLFYLFEKYILKLKELESYSIIDLLVTSLFHGFSIGIIIYLILFL